MIKLENGILTCNQKEFDLIKKWSNMMASPYVAGLYLYHNLKREDTTITWNQYYFRDIILAYRKKNYKVEE